MERSDVLDAMQTYGAVEALERLADALLADAGEDVTFRWSERDADGRDVRRFGAFEDGTLPAMPMSYVDSVMMECPLGLPSHRPASRFTWRPARGRSGRRVYRVLGSVKMMRLALAGQYGQAGGLIGPPVNLSRIVARLMGAVPRLDRPNATPTTRAGRDAVKARKAQTGMRARPTGMKRGEANEGVPVDVERLARITNALATASGSWADRVG